MRSYTYGNVDMNQIANILLDQAAANPDGENNIVVGTDSQNFDDTKVVIVIALHRVGKGGIFFYDIQRVKRINDIRQKLYYETQQSLDYVGALMDALDTASIERDVDHRKMFNYTIHVDAGNNGPTQQLIPELVGWIHACGYEAVTKPASYAASTIADTLSK